MDNWLPRHRITVDEYYGMVQAGLLAQDARVELIEGEIFDMAPIGTRHEAVVSRLNHLLVPAVGQRAIVRVQQSVRLSRSSEPQPDLALVKPRTDFYSEAHPTASDTLLVIEVSDTTLRFDHEIKMPLYARHGVPEAWIVDVRAHCLHCLKSPRDGRYAETSTIDGPRIVAITALPGVTLDLSGLSA